MSVGAIRQPERARGRSLRARVVRLFWLDIGLVGRVPVQEGVRDVEGLRVWGGDHRATTREARPPLARDIDRADPKSRRWMCA